MKIYQKLILNALIPVLFLGSITLLFSRMNSVLKSDSGELLKSSLPEVKASRVMTKSLENIQVATEEFLLDLNNKKKENSDSSNSSAQKFLESAAGEEVLKASRIIRENLNNFERELIVAREINFTAMESPNNSEGEKYYQEEEKIKWLEEIGKEFYLYQDKVERYFLIAEDDLSQGYSFLESELEPQIRNVLYPLVIKYQNRALEELQNETQEVRNDIDKEDKYGTLIAVFTIVTSLGMGITISNSIYKPLERLNQSVSQGEKGVLEPIEVLDLNKNNELATLAQKFNQMVEGLKRTTVSRSYLDKILVSLIDSLIVISLDGTIQKVNQATSKLLGYQESELINKNIKLILADEALSVEKLVLQKEINNQETTYLTKEGRKIPISFSSSVLLQQENSPEAIVCLARDITQKHISEKALRESEQRYALAARAANDGLWDWNLLSKQIYFSPRWKSLLGYEDEAIADTPDEWFKRVHPNHLKKVSQAIISYLQNPISPLEISYPMLHRDNSYRWMLCRAIAVKNEHGVIFRLTGSQTDITSSRLAEQKLRHQALYDGLTSLPNRRFFLEKLNKLFELHRKGQKKMFAVLFIDLDNFKKINDSLGHLAGDELLIAFSRGLKECITSEDTLTRLGGDEFAILVDSIQELSNAIKLAERIVQKLKKPLKLMERELFITASIGLAPWTNKYSQVEDLLRDADTAMYRAKAAGKGCYTVFQPEMYLEAVTALELENDLRRAVEQKEFQVFYQPIVKLSNGQIVGFEALVRWQHPKGYTVAPGEFIPIAEETGLIVPLGYQVMERACHQMRQWQEKYGVAQTMTLSVNFSPVQLKQLDPNNPTNCLEKIQEILEKTGLDPHCLKLEITESTIMESLERASSVIENIKTLGIKLSMDDFGTGYSSLNYLHKLPVDILKIDRSFVNELGIDSQKLSLTRTIVELAQSLKMEVIAEGVETEKQQAILTEINCEYGQGYLFSKPVIGPDAEILIATMEQFTKYFPLSYQQGSLLPNP
jgi:diguanylate cyclase (GGDEF)-like protein/PAS domain S-box-containing protein